MAKLSVGIQDNISVESVNIAEDGTLEISLVQSSGTGNTDLFAALTSGESMDEENKSTIKKFPVTNKRYGKEASADELIKRTIKEEQAFFDEVVAAYNPSKKVDYSNMFEGTGIASAEELKERITMDGIMNKISINMNKAFVEAMQGADATIKNRVKFYRMSEAKPFITFPQSVAFKKDGGAFKTPFIEPMTVAKADSKLSYTDYEKGIRNGVKSAIDRSSNESVTADAAPINDLPF